jgi:hypothetical protein
VSGKKLAPGCENFQLGVDERNDNIDIVFAAEGKQFVGVGGINNFGQNKPPVAVGKTRGIRTAVGAPDLIAGGEGLLEVFYEISTSPDGGDKNPHFTAPFIALAVSVRF